MLIPFKINPYKKGFTLIELLIIIGILAIVSVSAFYSYTQAAKTFGFLGDYKKIISVMRNARSYALTNKEAGGELPDRYGIQVAEVGDAEGDKWVIKLFAEGTGSTELMNYDNGDINILQKSLEFSDEEYEFMACIIRTVNCDEDGALTLTMPLQIFYEKGGGELTIFSSDDLGTRVKVTDNIAILFEKGDQGVGIAPDFQRYVVIFKVSGLAEEYKYPLPWAE